MFFVMIDLSEGTFPHLHAKNLCWLLAGMPLLRSQIRQSNQKLNHDSARYLCCCDKRCKAKEYECRFHNCVFDGTKIASVMPCRNFLSAGAIVASVPRNLTRSRSTK